MAELTEDQLTRLNELMQDFYDNKDDSKLPEIFSHFDRNGNGRIEASELKTVLSQISGEKVSENEVLEMIREADINKNGVIEVNEFIEIMKKQRDN